jgi:hypothetical protein
MFMVVFMLIFVCDAHNGDSCLVGTIGITNTDL